MLPCPGNDKLAFCEHQKVVMMDFPCGKRPQLVFIRGIADDGKWYPGASSMAANYLPISA